SSRSRELELSLCATLYSEVESLECSLFGKDGQSLLYDIRFESYGWIVSMERYLKLNFVQVEKLHSVVIALVDHSLNWYQWWEEQSLGSSWKEFNRVGILHIGIIEQIHVGLELNDTESLSELMVLALLHEEEKNLCSTEMWTGCEKEKKNRKGNHHGNTLTGLAKVAGHSWLELGAEIQWKAIC
ncbi:hypothetical protein L195_g022569, partial [Trifolium pratense]